MSDASVTRESRTYSWDSPYSFFRDQSLAALNDFAARERLERHAIEVAKEVEAGSAEGRRALQAIEQRTREMDSAGRKQVMDEVRAATSTSLAGFTTPQYVIDQYAVFRGSQRTFADQCTNLPIGDVGLSIHVPRFTAAASGGVRAEGSTVTEVDPTGLDSTTPVVTISVQVTASQQLLDQTRNAPNGPVFDAALYAQMRDSYDHEINNYVLGAAMGAGNQVTGNSSFGLSVLGSFLQDVALGREKLTDVAGTRLMPTHLLTTPDLYSYLTRQVDDQHRPIIVPAFAPGKPIWPNLVGSDEPHGEWDQFSGVVVPGSLMWFLDAAIPASSSTSQFIVSRPNTILLFEGDPVTRAVPETLANQLNVVTQLYGYACCIPRYPGATSVINGSAYTTSLI